MRWLDERTEMGQAVFTFEDVAQFTFAGQRIALMDRQRGIRKPAQLDAALSIRTTFTPPNQVPPYADAEGPDGLVRYKYRGTNPGHPENVALRVALEYALPLVWFVGVGRGTYVPIYPTWIVGDEPLELQFVVAFDVAQRLVEVGHQATEAEQRYVKRLTRQRLHQPVFRVQVLTAYRNQCSMCRLRYPVLLDAAHIIPDGRPHGQPVVPNGLSLCKIHHAAFDENLLGIRPDLVVELRKDILTQQDGPMLLHGLQDMHGVQLTVPKSRNVRPDQDRLEERYEEFRRAG